MATTAIVPRMTQSLTTSLFSGAVDLARITVPTSPYLPCRKTGMAAAIRDPVASMRASTGLPAFFASRPCASAWEASWVQLPCGMPLSISRMLS